MFLHVSVILYTRGSASVHAGIPTPSPKSRHPPAADNPAPLEQAPPGQTPPRPVHAGIYGQQAGDTHPTGMHSCYICGHQYKKKNFLGFLEAIYCLEVSQCVYFNLVSSLPAKVMFLLMSVILLTGEYASVHAEIPPLQEQTPPPRSRQPPRGADTPQADTHPPEQTPPGSRLRHTVNERPVRILL